MGEQPNNRRGVNFLLLEEGGGRVGEKLSKKVEFFSKKYHFSYKPTLPNNPQKQLNTYTKNFFNVAAIKIFKNGSKKSKNFRFRGRVAW